MTETLGTMHWRALDRDGEDKCRLARHEDGYMLVGHARFRDGSGWAALDYVVRCGPDWLTRSADVTGTLGGRGDALPHHLRGRALGAQRRAAARAFRLQRHRLLLHPGDQPDAAAPPARGRRLPVRAAWMRLPGPRLDPLDQSYTRERGGLVSYQAAQTGYEAQISVDPCGFPIRYPGLWQQVEV